MARCSPRGFTVFDIDYRMSRYDESGTFVEVSPVRLEGLASPYHMACQADGRIAAINWDLAGGSRLGFHTALARLRILDADGTERTDFGERIGSERFGRPAGSGPHPAGRSTLFGFQQKDLIVADGSFFGFERWSEEGKLTELVRLEMPAKDVESIMAEYMEISLARAASDEQRRAWRQEIEAMEGPERASYISGLHVTDDRVLVRELSVSRTGRWFEFAADGTPVGWWPLPPASVLLDVQGELVLVVERDELGVPRAVLYQIVPGPDRTGA